MKKKVLKGLMLVAAAILLVVATVLGTLAYLTSSSAVSNTFTVGNVGIQMFETPVDASGKKVSGAGLTSDGNSYHLQPGGRYDKDPTVIVDASSDESYLFVKVRNDLRKVEASAGEDGENGVPGTYKTMFQQVTENGNWIFIGRTDNANVYVYHKFIGKGDNNVKGNIPVFNEFMIAKDADLSHSGGAKVTLTAFAIQTTGFKPAGATDATDLDAARKAWQAIGVEYDYEDTTLKNTTTPLGKNDDVSSN